MSLVDHKDVIYHDDHISILSLERDKRRNLRVCRSPKYMVEVQSIVVDTSLYLA